MKKLIYILFIGTSILLASCGKDTKEKSAVEYQCPMKCEAEKVYSEEGTCPTCKMDLKLTEKSVQKYKCPMKCEEDKVYTKKGTCPICKMDLNAKSEEVSKIISNEISEVSIFNLTSKWNTEEGKSIELKELKGKTLVMVMIYTTCKAACPRLTADMRNIASKIPPKYKKEVQYILVSINPKTDTPKKLKEYAIANYIDGAEWTFLQGTEDSVREFSNVLSVKYKKISPLDFSHSNIISVFNPQGELVHQQEGLGVDNKKTIHKIIETVQK